MDTHKVDNQLRYLEFTLGEEHFAIPLLAVRELISVPETTEVPFSPKYFVGIMNLRGQVISIIDLRKKMSIARNEELTEEAVIIVEYGDISLGVIVDEICKVLAVIEDQIQEIPSIEAKSNEGHNKVFKNGENLVQLMDLDSILNVKELTKLTKKAA